MDGDESRRVTLDAGLTALAPRSLHERDGHYPFVEPTIRRRPHGRSVRTDNAGWPRPFLAFLACSRDLVR
jgi:hypothetical protein